MGSILMSVMNYVSSEIKIIAVKHSLVGTESLNQSAARFGVSRSTLQKWLLNYEMFGTEGLCHRAGNHHYSKEIKREAVEAYLSGRTSEEEICKKYQIRSRTQLEKWISLTVIKMLLFVLLLLLSYYPVLQKARKTRYGLYSFFDYQRK